MDYNAYSMNKMCLNMKHNGCQTQPLRELNIFGFVFIISPKLNKSSLGYYIKVPQK